MISRGVAFACLILLCVSVVDAARVPHQREKRAAIATVEGLAPELIGLSDSIWSYAETALEESKSSKLLADRAEAAGFRVTRGIAGLPTAFLAEYGSGSPIIAILAEYDALPGISQKALAAKEPLLEGAAGHGCGHNLFGAGSLGAAIAVKNLIEQGRLRGTIRLYGTPAEEAVGGKLYMVRDGLFDDVDVVLAWHPDGRTRADTKSTQALIDLVVEFRGRAAHAAFDPWNARSASDGAEIFAHALNLFREHVRPSVRMHYVIVEAGRVPNVVPDYAKVWCWVRDTKRAGVEELLARVRKIAEGAALAADVTAELTVQGGDSEMLVNRSGARLLHANLEWLGPVPFTSEEQEFARMLQAATGVPAEGLVERIEPLAESPGDPEGGSTDVADVSWVAPVLHLSVATAPPNTPWHAWPVVACSGMSIGHKGMVHAAKVLAVTMVDLFKDPAARRAIRGEFEGQTKGEVYRPLIPAGPPPVRTQGPAR
ncbi:MAG TPA: amidohydrolase [Thermoanaerobaculia bacterium]|nr:amidohydrolase [Thermoanaerobaculia bacterium]